MYKTTYAHQMPASTATILLQTLHTNLGHLFVEGGGGKMLVGSFPTKNLFKNLRQQKFHQWNFWHIINRYFLSLLRCTYRYPSLKPTMITIPAMITTDTMYTTNNSFTLTFYPIVQALFSNLLRVTDDGVTVILFHVTHNNHVVPKNCIISFDQYKPSRHSCSPVLHNKLTFWVFIVLFFVTMWYESVRTQAGQNGSILISAR